MERQRKVKFAEINILPLTFMEVLLLIPYLQHKDHNADLFYRIVVVTAEIIYVKYLENPEIITLKANMIDLSSNPLLAKHFLST